MSNLFSLEGKIALVTGGSKGIGRVFAETYAEAGAEVIITARNIQNCEDVAAYIEKKYGVKSYAKQLDVSNEEQVINLVKEIENEFKKIDVLVNSAGISGVEKPVVELSGDELDEVLNTNFKGAFFVSREVAKIMMKRKEGRIINISSVAAKGAIPRLVSYCSSKSAMLSLTKVMAIELVRYNIQVNAVCPGYFLTDMNKEFFSSERGKLYIKERIPIGRLGELEELKTTALYLATAPAYLTGAEIVIDGGQMLI